MLMLDIHTFHMYYYFISMATIKGIKRFML